MYGLWRERSIHGDARAWDRLFGLSTSPNGHVQCKPEGACEAVNTLGVWRDSRPFEAPPRLSFLP